MTGARVTILDRLAEAAHRAPHERLVALEEAFFERFGGAGESSDDTPE